MRNEKMSISISAVYLLDVRISIR